MRSINRRFSDAKNGPWTWAALVAAAFALAGCGGGSGGSGFDEGRFGSSCPILSGGGTSVESSVSPSCVDCSVNSPANAIDGNGDTFATLAMPANSAGSVAVRGIAQDGVVFAAGSDLGMVHSIAYGQSTGLLIALNTYLDGIQQESFTFNSGAGSSDQSPSSPGTATFSSSMQFDAVELNFTRASGTGEVTARLHLLCAG